MAFNAHWLIAGWLGVAIAQAEVPGILNFQGRIISGSSVFDGTGQFKFALVNGDGTASYWLNSTDGNADGEPDAAVSLPVTRGLYSVLIGDSSLSNMGSLGSDVFENGDVYLRVWFSDGENGFQMLAPDQRVAASGYALMAASIMDGAVGLEKLASGVLSAGNITGTFSDAQLPGNVALKDPDLLGASNVLSGEISVLAARLAALDAQVAALTNGQATLPAGVAVASPEANDTELIAGGYARLSSFPAPEWRDGIVRSKSGGTDIFNIWDADAPSARWAHTTVWTGTEMIVWGGIVGAGLDSAQGGGYDPVADRWREISTLNAPARRSGHSGVWTGTEMIVWGGYSTEAAGYVSSGGRLGESGWTALAKGAPAEREGHSAVWTGARMVVWGGKNANGLLNDGGTYDPANNGWTATPSAGAPSARFGAPAVLAGDKILIWGGEGESGALGTGGQLRAAAGVPTEWTRMNEVNAPEPRFGHTMVWTGTKLLVWGGSWSKGYLNTGGIYDAATDTWEEMNGTDAPAGRRNHVAVWTGSEMVVFGGENGSGVLNTGGAFNPVTGKWRALTNGGDPQARSGAGAVWTGTELVVFGGKAGGSPIQTPQLLVPEPTWHLYRKL